VRPALGVRGGTSKQEKREKYKKKRTEKETLGPRVPGSQHQGAKRNRSHVVETHQGTKTNYLKQPKRTKYPPGWVCTHAGRSDKRPGRLPKKKTIAARRDAGPNLRHRGGRGRGEKPQKVELEGKSPKTPRSDTLGAHITFLFGNAGEKKTELRRKKSRGDKGSNHNFSFPYGGTSPRTSDGRLKAPQVPQMVSHE